MSDDLKTRLRRTETERDTEGEEYAVTVNPDGPEAAARIEALERDLAATLKREHDANVAAFGHLRRADAAEAALAAMTAERERLALAICGGEDAPGYANAQPVEALEKVARDNAAAWMWQVDQTTKAEARLAKAVEVLRMISRLRPETLAVDYARATLADALAAALRKIQDLAKTETGHNSAPLVRFAQRVEAISDAALAAYEARK